MSNSSSASLCAGPNGARKGVPSCYEEEHDKCWVCGYYDEKDEEEDQGSKEEEEYDEDGYSLMVYKDKPTLLRADVRIQPQCYKQKEKLICVVCLEEAKNQPICMVCTAQGSHTELKFYDSIENYYNDSEKVDRHICVTCLTDQQMGKCSHINPIMLLEGHSVIRARCTRKAIYEDPDCCGRPHGAFADGRCDQCQTLCCDHPNHPTAMTRIKSLNQSLCNQCLEQYQNQKKQAKKDARRAIDDAEYMADVWAQEHTAYDKKARIRSIRIKM